MNLIVTGTVIHETSNDYFKKLMDKIINDSFINEVKEELKYWEKVDHLDFDTSLEYACIERLDDVLVYSHNLEDKFLELNNDLSKLNSKIDVDSNFDLDYEFTFEEMKYIKNLIKQKLKI